MSKGPHSFCDATASAERHQSISGHAGGIYECHARRNGGIKCNGYSSQAVIAATFPYCPKMLLAHAGTCRCCRCYMKRNKTVLLHWLFCCTSDYSEEEGEGEGTG